MQSANFICNLCLLVSYLNPFSLTIGSDGVVIWSRLSDLISAKMPSTGATKQEAGSVKITVNPAASMTFLTSLVLWLVQLSSINICVRFQSGKSLSSSLLRECRKDATVASLLGPLKYQKQIDPDKVTAKSIERLVIGLEMLRWQALFLKSHEYFLLFVEPINVSSILIPCLIISKSFLKNVI